MKTRPPRFPSGRSFFRAVSCGILAGLVLLVVNLPAGVAGPSQKQDLQGDKATTIKPKPAGPDQNSKPAAKKNRDELYRDVYTSLWTIRRQVKRGVGNPIGVQRHVDRMKMSLRLLQRFDPKSATGKNEKELKSGKAGTTAVRPAGDPPPKSQKPEAVKSGGSNPCDRKKTDRRKETIDKTFKAPTAEEMKLRHLRIEPKTPQKKVAAVCKDAFRIVDRFEDALHAKTIDIRKLNTLLDEREKKLDSLQPRTRPPKTDPGKPPKETVVK